MKEIKTKLIKILADIRPELAVAAEQGRELGELLGSLDTVAIVTEIDEALGIMIPPEEIVPESFRDLDSLTDLIQRLLGEG